MENFSDIHKVYFVGIGGIAMSAAAGFAREQNFDVLGSDSRDIYPPAKDVLDREKISYSIGYDQQNIINSKADLFIISAGEDLTNPEVAYIYSQNLPHMGLAEFFYELNKDRLRIVVTGTNGKSTTTALLGHVLKNMDDSSFMAGAVLLNYGSNFHVGSGHYAVFEGDEYKAEFDDPTPKFHFYKPDILLLTNLEWDHPDIFENLDAIITEFRQLIEELPEDGLIVYNADDENLVKLLHETEVSSVSFGIENEADFKVENIKFEKDFTTIEVENKFSKNISAHLLGQTEQYKIQLPGKMNVYNALGVIALLRSLGFEQEQIALDLLSFQGLKRRFEVVAVKNGITIIDDYAHFPTAIRETLQAARQRYFQSPTSNLQHSKLWAIFEPHTFSRTQATLSDLAKSFTEADEILISEIYPAREKAKDHNITSADVVRAVEAHSEHVRLVNNKSDALNVLKKEAKPGDVIMVMAVGDFNRLAYELKQALI